MNYFIDESNPGKKRSPQTAGSTFALCHGLSLSKVMAVFLSGLLAFSLCPLRAPSEALASESDLAVAESDDTSSESSSDSDPQTTPEPDPVSEPEPEPTPEPEPSPEPTPAVPVVKVNKSGIVKAFSSSSAVSVWLRKTSSTDGYEVAYSTSSKFAKYHTKKLSKSKTYVRITGLSAKTKYYVKVRCYKVVNGKKYYSGWSQARSATTAAKKKSKKGKPSLKASKVAKYMKKQVGKSGYGNMCLSFVEVSWIRMGTKDTRCIPCAYEYGRKYRISTSTNIPIGADVYFSGGYTGCGGHRAGHVGIYIGNGYMVNALGGKIKKTKITSYINSGGGHKYYGWGYHRDVTVDADILDTTTDAFGMTINLSPKASSSSVGKVKVSWSKSKAASGYQVCVTQGGKKRYSFAKGAGCLSKTVSGLKSGASCSVKVRPYVKSKGRYVYGSWNYVDSLKVL